MSQKKTSSLQQVSLALFLLCFLAVLAVVGPWALCTRGLAGDPETMALCAEDHPMRQSGLPAVVALFALAGGIVTRQLFLQQTRREAREEVRVRRTVERTAMLTPVIHYRERTDASSEVPVAIELDEALDFGVPTHKTDALSNAEGESLMAYVEDERKRVNAQQEAAKAAAEAPTTVDGFYCPPGLETGAILYVDPSHDSVGIDPEARVNNPAQPYTDVTEALRHASKIVQESGQRVQVRLMPGVYQTTLDIPDRVAVVNHRMPAEGTIRQRMAWLEEQDTIDHPERVTLLPPGDQDYAIRFGPGRLQGLFGVHVVGREGARQTGIKTSGNMALAILHSSIEGFSRGALQMTASGETLSGRQGHIVGCRFKANTSLRPGAAINVQRSVLVIEDCIFDSNTATIGGAIYAKDLTAPLVITGSTLSRNRARTKKELTDPLPGLKLVEWQNQEGLGGAIAVDRSRLKVVDCIFDGNDATLGGGAIALLGGGLVVQANNCEHVAFTQNRAVVGGGLLAIGWVGAKCQVKSQASTFQGNIARSFGGAIALVGLSVLQLEQGKLSTNGCTGKDGIGAGLGLFRGARALIDGVDICDNRARVHGGGLAIINGSAKLVGTFALSGNEAETGKGGGLYAITGHDAEMDTLIPQADIDLPFSLVLENVTIEHNKSRGPGAGLYAGNTLPHASFPLQITLPRPEIVWNNRSQADERESHDLLIRWAHETRASSRDKNPLDLQLN
jgi:predicted outer membrane repeat protein